MKILSLAGAVSGVQLLIIVKLLDIEAWQIIAALFTTNVVTLAVFRKWLAFSPQSTSDEPKGDSEKEMPPVDPTVQIAHETLPYLRRGLNETTARKTAEIIQKIAEVPAVAVTDREKVLAYLGVGCEKHQPGDRILTEATKEVIATGQYKVVQTTKQLNCPMTNCDCPLAAAVIVPLKCRDEVVGTLKLYQTTEGQLPPHVIRLAIGIAQLLSMQIELAELDRQTQLLTLAKLDALHAQINPHFFFNVLNTIIMYSRTNPTRARRLLIRLADFFRQTLKRHGHLITLREELECVNTYLVLEKARFGDKLRIVKDVDKNLLDYKVPVFSLQPLVENAVKHGITPKEGTGTVKISARVENNELVMSVADDGVGIPADKLNLVLQPGYGSGNGVGLSNVHQRLQSLYGEEYGLQIVSCAGEGTVIYLRIPLDVQIDTEERAGQGGLPYYEVESANR
ncbi:histidine kinase [Calderihabitans maritimus]|uniref:histidine kinase n=1 Tax=Calderihabitans maritimus TaxID=1246530 RepID=UPI003D1608BF